MKEITIISGKGGTGKTTITAALSSIAENAVFCDSDVDAADLHLILKPQIIEEHTFLGAWVAEIDEEKCINCNICKDYCRFDAIHQKEFGGLYINPYQCEGCRLCERVCPVKAINSERSLNNFWYVSNTRFGKMVHAKMGPGEENSGKLVTEVRKKAKELAIEAGCDFILTDGPPGIGCAAISSITGSQSVLLVIEPSKSGLHDAKRVVELVKAFNTKIFALINKFDLNLELTDEIEKYLKEESIPMLAQIPFDTKFVESMILEKTIVEYSPDSEISKSLKSIWEELKKD